MAQDTRVGERQPTSMRIKLKYPDVETFIQKYAVNISRGGIFIATKTPKPVGTPLKFEFVLAAGESGLSIIRGEGQVLWTREFDPAQPHKAHGMGVKFTRLDAESQAVVDRALAFRARESDSSQPVPTAAVSPTPTPAPAPAPPPVASAPPPASAPAPVASSAPPVAAAPAIDSSAPPPIVSSAPPPEPPTKETKLPDAPVMGRAPDEVTRPLPVDAPTQGRTREDVTRPITVEEATRETRLPPEPRVKVALERDPSREIRIRGGSREGALSELDAIAREWGVSEEQIERILKRRRPRMVEATAELERLLRKPPKTAPPTKEEAMAGLRELLSQRTAVLEIDARSPRRVDAQAAGGDETPLKKAR